MKTAILLPVLLAPGLLALVLRTAPEARASWSGATPIGADVVTSDASCAADGNGTAVCAALGTGSTMMVARFNGTSWSGWTHLTGVLTATPSCTEIRTAQVICGSRNAGLQLVTYLWNGSTWSAPLALVSGLVSEPSCAALSNGRAVCAARSSAGGIVSDVYDGTGWATSSWSAPAVVSEALYSPIQCTPDDLGHAICAYLSKDSATTVREFGTAWSGGINIGGTATHPPVCTDAGVAGKVGCFATGTESALYGQPFAGGSFTAGNWGGYGSLGGLVHSYSCTQDGQKAGLVHYVCGVVGLTDDALYTDEYNGSSWEGFVSRRGTYIGTPSCLALNRTVTPGRVMCVLTTNATKAVSVTGP